MKRIMLDTNMVSHFIKGHATVNAHVLAAPMAALCISVVTEAELRYGLAKRPQAKQLKRVVEEFLCRVDVLPWNSPLTRRYGEVRAKLEQGGKTLGALDLLIAVHALEVDALLVTNDHAFYYVDGLRIEDWTR
ncbi:type II toxin-antitoxin system VapC family toxin [Pistricoccus aurantiacus]|uniref:Type II toxin-antitoxin system VapC family toxin n=2 Tax=Pistricoccus aurantiacus TaxID=1883414 RepID=A0A5B8SML7_9GAMM|nr:type II toxin-antitoxin system VapC family toxin [Pistricoccus aurantiacus]